MTGWLPAPVEELFGPDATAEESYEVLTVDVPPTSWIAALETSREVLGCTYFDWLSAVDEPGTGFRVMAHLAALGPLRRLLVRTTVPHSAPVLPSAVSVYAGAGWHERETHEMFGVTFEGHPGLAPCCSRRASKATPPQGLRPRRTRRQGLARRERTRRVRARRPQAPPDAPARRPRPQRVGAPQGPTPSGPGPPGPRRRPPGRRPPGAPGPHGGGGLGEPDDGDGSCGYGFRDGYGFRGGGPGGRGLDWGRHRRWCWVRLRVRCSCVAASGAECEPGIGKPAGGRGSGRRAAGGDICPGDACGSGSP